MGSPSHRPNRAYALVSISTFLHIGLHKTGTTYLQRTVFPAMDLVVSTHEATSPRISAAISELRGRPLLISDEGLSGDLFGGHWLEDFERTIDTLAALYQEPRIIVGFREHGSFLLSAYKQYLQEGGTGPFETVFDPARGAGLILAHEMWYQSRIEYLDARFEHVLVYTNEQMRDNLGGLLGRLADFMGVPAPLESDVQAKHNVSLSGERQARLLRHLNRASDRLARAGLSRGLYSRWFRRFGLDPRSICQYRLAFLSGNPLRLPPAVSTIVNETYGEDWRWTRTRAEGTHTNATAETAACDIPWARRAGDLALTCSEGV